MVSQHILYVIQFWTRWRQEPRALEHAGQTQLY